MNNALSLLAYYIENREPFRMFSSMCCMIPFCLIVPLMIGFQIWMLVEVITKEPSEDKDKTMWLLIVLLVGVIGGLIYFFVRRPKRKQLYGR